MDPHNLNFHTTSWVTKKNLFTFFLATRDSNVDTQLNIACNSFHNQVLLSTVRLRAVLLILCTEIVCVLCLLYFTIRRFLNMSHPDPFQNPKNITSSSSVYFILGDVLNVNQMLIRAKLYRKF